jgi:hypothetical protein
VESQIRCLRIRKKFTLHHKCITKPSTIATSWLDSLKRASRTAAGYGGVRFNQTLVLNSLLEKKMIVARLDGSKNISEILNKLEGLEYEVSVLNDKTGYVFRKNASSSDLSRDVKATKAACNFSGTIKSSFGSSTGSY